MKLELQYFVWRRCKCINQRMHSVIVNRFFRGFAFKIAAWKLRFKRLHQAAMYIVHLKRVLPITRRPYSKQLSLSFLQDSVIFGTFRCAGKSAKSACYLLHVSPCLSVRIEQFVSQGTDFHKNRYSSFFQISVEKIQVSLKSDKNKRYITRRPMNTYDNIPLNSF